MFNVFVMADVAKRRREIKGKRGVLRSR